MAQFEPVAIMVREGAGGVPNLNGPSGPPPPGVVPQLENPPNGNHIAVPVMCVCTILIVILYSIRFWAKWQTKKLNKADYVSFAVIVSHQQISSDQRLRSMDKQHADDGCVASYRGLHLRQLLARPESWLHG
jgi:hypothetical protein